MAARERAESDVPLGSGRGDRNSSTEFDAQRRRVLVQATGVVGAAGLFATTWPFIVSWQPSEGARARGGPVTVALDKIEPGQLVTVQWRRKPVWVLRRTPQMLESLNEDVDLLRDPKSQMTSQQPPDARNSWRSIKPEYLVLVGICTHLGCVPHFRPRPAAADLGSRWPGGFFCPCHGSRFDLAGRVFKSVPAPTNLVVPPYRYPDPSHIIIGT